MERTYLFVPPEEKGEVQALGAQWDADSKRWYVVPGVPLAEFSRWLSPDGDESEYTITSSEAYVACADVACQRCGADIEVVCIHCESGTVSDEALTRFTVSDIWAMDEALTRQLRRWPTYRRGSDSDGEPGDFANHCSRCGASQDDLYLHSEPDAPFFDIPHAAPGSVRLTPLEGTIRLSGDEHFEVEELG